jgi:DNA-binding NarL/FixJ family response regulator
MTSVLLADDNRAVRRGLRQIIDEEPDLRVTGEAESAAELLDRVRAGGRWDVLVLDIGLPDRSGLDALREIKALRPQLKVLILSMHTEGCYVTESLNAGACGYVGKADAAEEIVRAIRAVAAGGRYISPRLDEGMPE